MPEPSFWDKWEWARAHQKPEPKLVVDNARAVQAGIVRWPIPAPPTSAIGEIHPDAITLLDSSAPHRRPDAPVIGDVGTGALAVVDPFARSKRGMRDLLASHEASSKGYDTYYNDRKHNHPALPEKRISQMTLDEVYAYQDRLYRAYGSTPVGRYQFTKDTLKDMQNRLGVSGDAVFDQAMQDRLVDALLVEEGFEEYASGKMSASQFHDNIAGRWDSLEYRNSGGPYSERNLPSKRTVPKTTRAHVLGAISEIDRDREEYQSQA